MTRLYPESAQAVPLQGLYLAHNLRERGTPDRPYVYSNFVVSADGRISHTHPRSGRRGPPKTISHARDWALYLELAAQADAVLTSGRRLRELGADDDKNELQCVEETAEGALAEWRQAHGLPLHPACVILTASLDLPFARLRERRHGRILVVSGTNPERAQKMALADAGVELITVAGPRVSGDDVYRLAAERGFRTLYSIGGPEVLYTLASAGRLHRLYLSLALRLIAGDGFDTLLRGDALAPPLDLALQELYLDPPAAGKPAYLFATLDVTQ